MKFMQICDTPYSAVGTSQAGSSYTQLAKPTQFVKRLNIKMFPICDPPLYFKIVFADFSLLMTQ